jgi:hypothetical protein
VDDIERLVRVTFSDRAAAVEAPADLVRAARGRARQARRRAQSVGVAVAAAAVLLAVPAATRLWAPTPESTVDVAAAPAREVAVPPFPFTPTVPLPGYGEPIAELFAGVPALRYDGGPDRWLTVTVTAERPAAPPWDVAPESHNTAVHERKAVLELTPAGSALTWQAADGRWLRVEADQHLTRADLVGYAAGLVPGPVPVRWPFTFDAVPPGVVADEVSRAAVAFRPESAPPSHGFAGKLTVMLSMTAEVQPGGRPVAVGGRAGWLTAQSGTDTLAVDLGDGRTLVIQSQTGLSEADLVAFAAGVHPTPDAEVGQG